MIKSAEFRWRSGSAAAGREPGRKAERESEHVSERESERLSRYAAAGRRDESCE